ncbi:hypothetical protein B0J13DRAFT_455633 [Dactylonectria estremocensis]|uniref:Uncharacterized protein n=1 Tax=Dactylonectria estremocensis TaxID=1079267 RepID=A0A9P9ILB8_9HYPO|nr:hypothetical protein B0J13DRAFT_455633 [Dactylonectria estremocensis]
MASNTQTAPTDQTDLRVASTKEHRARFTRLTQTLLSISSNDCDLALIQITWSFRKHLTKPRRQIPSRLQSVLFNFRTGKSDDSTEARLYRQGASRAVNAFCAALQEVPVAQGSMNDRETAVSKHGGHHAVQAFRAADIGKDGDIGKATSLISEYGGTQALTMYAIATASDDKFSTQVENLSDGSIYCLLDCISNVDLHRDVSFMIETLFRQKKKPQWIPKNKHIGRLSRTGRQRRDHRLPGLNQQVITRNVAQRRLSEVDTIDASHLERLDTTQSQPASRALGRVSTPPPALSFDTGSIQPNPLDHWFTRDMAADDASQAPVPAEGSQVLASHCLGLLETNLNELTEQNFHFLFP